MGSIGRLISGGKALLLVSLLMAGAAWAQGTTGSAASGNPMQAIQEGSTPNGLAETIMRGLLGGVFDNPFGVGGGASTVFGAMFLAFNMFVFAAAVAWATYGVAAGIVQTAHEGVVLGKRLNAIWMPIRLVTGVGSLVPVFGGFSLSQAVMILALGWGINGANYVTNKAMGALANYTPMINPPTAKANTAANAYDLTTALFIQELCRLGHLKHEQEMAAKGVAVAPDSKIADFSGGFAQKVGHAQAVGSMVGTPQDPAACMAVGIARKSYKAPSGDEAWQFRNRSVNYEAINQTAYDRYQNSFGTLRSSVASLAATYAAAVDAQSNGGGVRIQYPAPQLRALASQFAASAQPADSTNVSSAIKDSTLNQVRSLGFLGLGMYYSMISEANTALVAAQNAAEYIIQESNGADVGGVIVRSLEDKVSSTSLKDFYVSALARAYSTSTGGAADSGQDANTMLNYSEPSSGFNIGQKILNLALGAVVTGNSGPGVNNFDLVDPIISAKNVGDYLMATASSIIMASAVSDVLEKIPGLGKALGKAADVAGKVGDALTGGGVSKAFAFVKTAAWVMLIIGIMLSLYIPFVPFLNWVAAMVQYVSTVVQSFVAAPLWSFAHVAVDGEGMGQRAERGYLFLLLVLFKPVLMVIAFFAAVGMVILIGSVVTWLFMPAVAHVQGNSVTGLFSIAALLLIYFIVLNTIIQGSFNLVEEISDDVIGWVGQAGKSGVGRGMDERAGTTILAGMRSARGEAMSIAGAAGKATGGR